METYVNNVLFIMVLKSATKNSTCYYSTRHYIVIALLHSLSLLWQS